MTVVRAFSPLEILRRASAPGAVLAAVLLVAGCGGGGGGSAGQESAPTTTTGAASAAAGVVNVTGTEYELAPSTLKVSAGKTTIRFTNGGAIEHDFSIDALRVHLHALPGEVAEATVNLKPGTYKSYCSVPGHLQSGMHGTLKVS